MYRNIFHLHFITVFVCKKKQDFFHATKELFYLKNVALKQTKLPDYVAYLKSSMIVR